MTLANKIIRLRKTRGWSQEELAERMNVSRQAVSKWESCQATPDVEKILQLSNLFEVTTDYLLKNEEQEEVFFHQEKVDFPKTEKPTIVISMDETQRFLNRQKQISRRIALGVFLCIISPITLIVLLGATEIPGFALSEAGAVAAGLPVMFVLVSCGVAIFLHCGFKGEPFEFLEKNVPFELEVGVKDMVLERKNQFRDGYIKGNIIAVCVCIFSPLPILVSIGSSGMVRLVMVAATMVVAGLGVWIFIVVNVQNEALQKLLKEGEYSEREKARKELSEPVGGAYWGIVVGTYLVWSFTKDAWSISWVVFVAGGILFPVVLAACNVISGARDGE